MYSEQLQKNLKREGKSIFAGRPPLHRKEVRAQYDASLQYRISEYAIQNRIRICYTEYQNIYSYMQYKITQIFHAAFLCTDYAIYIIDVPNI